MHQEFKQSLFGADPVRIKYSPNSPLIRHAVFSIHSFQDQSWSYK